MSTRDRAAEVLAARLPRLISPAMPGQLADALADAGLLRDEHAEEALADAWDEGYYAGEGADRDSFYWRGHPGGTNPYRAALRGD